MQIINYTKFIFSVFHKMRKVQFLACNAFAKFLRCVVFTMHVNIGTQPTKQFSEIAGLYFGNQIFNIFSRLIKKLRGIKTSKRVCGKITKGTVAPMNIL